MKEQELFNVPVPVATETYKPVSHQFLAEMIAENVDKQGLTITGKTYNAANGGQEVVGYLDLAADSAEFGYRLAWRNSYNKSRPVAFVAGTSVLICSNGMILGESQYFRRHTGTVRNEVQQRIESTIGEIGEMMRITIAQAERMKSVELDKTATAELCGRMLMEHEIITTSQLSIIRQELKTPTYPELAEDNLWGLYNHTTHALKKTHPYHYIEQHQKLHQFVAAEFNL